MRLIAERKQAGVTGVERHYFLGYCELHGSSTPADEDLLGRQETLLDLLYAPARAVTAQESDPIGKAGYWKIGITLADVDLARQSLIDAGVQVSDARQFLDVGYLCHLEDPDGHSIELLQHRFAHDHESSPQSLHRLRSAPTLGQITLRIKDPAASLRFYIEGMGMRLLSRQVIELYRFTLYFLACTDEEPPIADIDSVGNREWLWQRPYTVLELQHIWGTEEGDFSYRVGSDTGFEHISFATDEIDRKVDSLANWGGTVTTSSCRDTLVLANTATVLDPDGYSIRLIETG